MMTRIEVGFVVGALLCGCTPLAPRSARGAEDIEGLAMQPAARFDPAHEGGGGELGTWSDEMTLVRQIERSCPMSLAGVQVEVADVRGGVALTFTTESGDVDKLRQRVEALGDAYRLQGGERHLVWRVANRAQTNIASERAGHNSRALPAAMVFDETVVDGARLVLVPVDAGRLDELRAHVRIHRQRMDSGECFALRPRR